MELRRELLTAEMIERGTGQLVRTTIEVRFDPLTGHSSRILPERGLMPAQRLRPGGVCAGEPAALPILPGPGRPADA